MTGILDTTSVRSSVPWVKSANIANAAMVTEELTTPEVNRSDADAAKVVAKPVAMLHKPMPPIPANASLRLPTRSTVQPQKTPKVLPRKYAHSSVPRRNEASTVMHSFAVCDKTTTCAARDEAMIASARKRRYTIVNVRHSLGVRRSPSSKIKPTSPSAVSCGSTTSNLSMSFTDINDRCLE